MLRSMIAVTLMMTAPAFAQTPGPHAAIEHAMASSAQGWNGGNLDRFMAVYADDAIYAAGGKVVQGKAAIAARYAKSFSSGGNSRGTLTFRMLAWRTLNARQELLVARWTLTPATRAKPQTGLTTLVFERGVAGWRIISDHSS